MYSICTVQKRTQNYPITNLHTKYYMPFHLICPPLTAVTLIQEIRDEVGKNNDFKTYVYIPFSIIFKFCINVQIFVN